MDARLDVAELSAIARKAIEALTDKQITTLGIPKRFNFGEPHEARAALAAAVEEATSAHAERGIPGVLKSPK
ncbi:MAG TPA: hypothetical protein VI670_27845 [Thermoanaerobaculia bacterium]|jgi:hypothetical protein